MEGAWSCLELAVSIPGQPWPPLREASPAPSHGQCLGDDTLCSNVAKTGGCFYVDGKIPFSGHREHSFVMLLNRRPTEVFPGPFSSYTPVLVTLVIAWVSGVGCGERGDHCRGIKTKLQPKTEIYAV